MYNTLGRSLIGFQRNIFLVVITLVLSYVVSVDLLFAQTNKTSKLQAKSNELEQLISITPLKLLRTVPLEDPPPTMGSCVLDVSVFPSSKECIGSCPFDNTNCCFDVFISTPNQSICGADVTLKDVDDNYLVDVKCDECDELPPGWFTKRNDESYLIAFEGSNSQDVINSGSPKHFHFCIDNQQLPADHHIKYNIVIHFCQETPTGELRPSNTADCIINGDFFFSCGDVNEIKTGAVRSFKVSDLFPNPTSIGRARFSYEIIRGGKLSIELSNETGHVFSRVLREHSQTGEFALEMNTSKLSQGIYFCKLEMNGQRVVKRIVIAR